MSVQEWISLSHKAVKQVDTGFIFNHGDDEPMIGTMSLVPQVVDNVTVPVVAAGGIMDGRFACEHDAWHKVCKWVQHSNF